MIEKDFKTKEVKYEREIISLKGDIDDIQRGIYSIEREKQNLIKRWQREKDIAFQKELKISVRDCLNSVLDKLEIEEKIKRDSKKIKLLEKENRILKKGKSVSKHKLPGNLFKKGSKFNLNNISVQNPIGLKIPKLNISCSRSKIKSNKKSIKINRSNISKANNKSSLTLKKQKTSLNSKIKE